MRKIQNFWFVLPLLDFFIFDIKGEKICWFDFTLNPLLMIDKKGEKYLCFCFDIYAWFPCLRGRSICPSYLRGIKICIYAYVFWFMQIGVKRFWFMLVASPYLHPYSCASWSYLLFILYAWVKGELLWSFTLIHAYITSWVLSSSKRGRLLAQRPITLVLMMINSWSYVY